MEQKVTIIVKFLGFWLSLYAAQYMYNWKNQTKTFDKKKLNQNFDTKEFSSRKRTNEYSLLHSSVQKVAQISCRILRNVISSLSPLLSGLKLCNHSHTNFEQLQPE